MRNDWFLPGDLAPLDVAKAVSLDVSGLDVRQVGGMDDPCLEEVYGLLWDEFGARGELEELSVLKGRLRWLPAARVGGFWLRYEMICVRSGGEIIAIRDHTAMISERISEGVWVHLSHVWVRPSWRRTGLTGWLRAWPMRCARECLRWAGRDVAEPVTLIAEMERPEVSDPATLVRLKAYEKGGFLKVDPERVGYVQPDFRSPSRIDESGGARPLPLMLLMRRVGGDWDPGGVSGARLGGRELKAMVGGLYQMYGAGFREEDMRRAWDTMGGYPGDEEWVALFPPSWGVGGEGVG